MVSQRTQGRGGSPKTEQEALWGGGVRTTPFGTNTVCGAAKKKSPKKKLRSKKERLFKE